jgi:hypothetical protein
MHGLQNGFWVTTVVFFQAILLLFLVFVFTLIPSEKVIGSAVETSRARRQM